MIKQYLDKCRTAISHPNLLGRAINQRYYCFRNRRAGGFNRYGVNIFERDWDNLLILDACRYDDFADIHNLPGRLTSVESRGARTPEFLHANFYGQRLDDVVYLNANPMLHRRLDEFEFSVYELFDLWKTDWDSETGTVLPETVKERTLTVAQQYPNKRLIIHFIQPHYPFLGSDNEFDQDPKKSSVRDNMWRRLERGNLDIPTEHLRELYRDNLRRALPAVKELIQNLQGKNIVTSDHGNMFGERSWPVPHKEWGHPPKIYTEELVKVPWLEYLNGNRKDIDGGDISSETELEDDSLVVSRLESLGYR